MSEAPVSRAEFDALLKELREVQARLHDFEERLSLEEDDLSEETVQIIAAAVAAYIGKRATIRIVRRSSRPETWLLQGRAALQASHAMPRVRGLNYN